MSTPLHRILSEKKFNIHKFNDFLKDVTFEDIAIQNDNLDTPFHTSIRNKQHYANLKLYAMAIKDPSIFTIRNSSKQTVLELALQVKDYGMVKKLVKIPELMNPMDSQGMNVLMRTIANREDDDACRIIQTPNIIDYATVGKFGTVLQFAVSFCAYNIVEILLEEPRVQEIINIKNNQGLTALNLAVMDESGTIALKIFAKGGNLTFDQMTVKRIITSYEPKIREILWPVLYLSVSHSIPRDILVRVMKYL